jgi:hypothetical protein
MLVRRCREHATRYSPAPALHPWTFKEGNVKTWLTIAVLVLGAGCATARGGSEAMASPGDLSPFSGQWSGTIMGRDMGSSQGRLEAPARLTLAADGHWTLTSSGGAVATGVAHRTARGIVANGRVTGGDPMTVGREVSFVLSPRGDGALYANGEGFFLGMRVDDEILLRRQTA